MPEARTHAAACTFHKCGSNWFRWILWHVARMQGRDYRPCPAGTGESGITVPALRGGRPIHVFPGGSPERMAEALGPGAAETEPVLLCLRDPRDALVSQYFSWGWSHANNTPRILALRERLTRLSPREGMRLLIAERQLACADQLARWLPRIEAGTGVTLLRYEGLAADFAGHLGEGLARSGIGLAGVDLAVLAEETAFSRLTGRQPGEERPDHHYRKGIVGDHRAYLDDALMAEYEAAYGGLTRRLGYG